VRWTHVRSSFLSVKPDTNFEFPVICWAVRAHQALRFFPDESVSYSYPEMYVKHFGPDYEPDDYIKEAYKRARDHK
jgi:hypothetical protein